MIRVPCGYTVPDTDNMGSVFRQYVKIIPHFRDITKTCETERSVHSYTLRGKTIYLPDPISFKMD